MPEKIVLCLNCGAKNRIPEGRSGSPKCGRCGERLSLSKDKKTQVSRIGLLLFLAVAGVGAILLYQFQAETPSPVTAPKRVSAADPTFSAPPLPVYPGVISGPRTRGLAPLTIQTSPGFGYYIKLVRSSGETEMTIYVKGGEYFKTTVPLGRYEMRYASGKTWYGARHLFGPKTTYSKADTIFEFTRTFEGYRGYNVRLIRQAGGNLPTRRIKAVQF